MSNFGLPELLITAIVMLLFGRKKIAGTLRALTREIKQQRF